MRHKRGWCSVDLEDVQIVQGVAAASLCYYQSDRISVASFACVDMNSEPVGLSAATIHIPRYLYHPVIPLSMAVMQSYLPVAFRIQHSNSSCRSRTLYKSQVPALTIPNSRMHANVVLAMISADERTICNASILVLQQPMRRRTPYQRHVRSQQR